jgi:hypothetical protein
MTLWVDYKRPTLNAIAQDIPASNSFWIATVLAIAGAANSICAAVDPAFLAAHPHVATFVAGTIAVAAIAIKVCQIVKS